MNETEISMYGSICRHDGIKAREIAREIGSDKTEINRLLYNAPFIKELCYRDDDYNWHGLIRQTRPHYGLPDFCGYYDTVDRFLELSEEEWMEELQEGCVKIGRNLNDTRGLLHSFRDSRDVMMGLFRDIDMPDASSWEICFELRIRRAKWIRMVENLNQFETEYDRSFNYMMLANKVRNTRSQKDIYIDLISKHDFPIFETCITDSACVGSALVMRKPVALHRSKSQVALDYSDLSDEIAALC